MRQASVPASRRPPQIAMFTILGHLFTRSGDGADTHLFLSTTHRPSIHLVASSLADLPVTRMSATSLSCPEGTAPAASNFSARRVNLLSRKPSCLCRSKIGVTADRRMSIHYFVRRATFSPPPANNTAKMGVLLQWGARVVSNRYAGWFERARDRQDLTEKPETV